MRVFMEYIENTFKMRKETKQNTVLCKAKEPKGIRPTYQQNQALKERRTRTNPTQITLS
jgi:hypothetical protein